MHCPHGPATGTAQTGTGYGAFSLGLPTLETYDCHAFIDFYVSKIE